MNFIRWAALLFATLLIAVPGTLADDKKPAPSATTADAASVVTTAANASAPAAPASTPISAAAPAPAQPVAAAPPPPSPTGQADADDDSSTSASPRFTPMPALDGNPGLFTLETGDTLPAHGISLGIGLNKFSRMPGEITQLQLIPAISYGVNRWVSVFFNIDAEDHLHVGAPSQLSLSAVNALNPQYLNTIYNSVIPSTGFRPGYVEDAPFASHTGTGVGEIDLGFKIGLLSERTGKPLSLSIRNDFYLPTQTGFSNLLSNQMQYGKFNYGIGVEASKTILHHSIVATANWSYRFTRDSTYNVSFGSIVQPEVLNLADQMQIGAGMLIFPDKRFQIITEYDATIFVGGGIKNTTVGARDPVDSLTGFRLYAWKWAALDLGYRYSLDLTGHRDRNGFVIKVGTAFWPQKPVPPDSVTSACAVDKSSVAAGSNEGVVATASATDKNGRPLNYLWTATGGKLSGVGSFVRWDSAGVAPGSYTLTSRVDNGIGNSSNCTVTVIVRP